MGVDPGGNGPRRSLGSRVHDLEPEDARDFLLEHGFHSELECQGGAGSADAGALHPDAHDAVDDVDELDVASVALHAGPDLLFQDPANRFHVCHGRAIITRAEIFIMPT
jgi:hypothetical protein